MKLSLIGKRLRAKPQMSMALLNQGMQHILELLKPIIQVNNIDKTATCISWKNRSGGIHNGMYYPLEYQMLIDKRDYSLLLSDGSFLQIYYELDTESVLKKARLAFYPKPINAKVTTDELEDAADEAASRDDEALFEHLYNLVDGIEKNNQFPVNTSHVRFDYDHKVTVHSKSHMQYGAVQDLRVPANFFPQPLAFVEMICPLIQTLPQYTLDSTHVKFAKNNALNLANVATLISLSSI